MERRPPEVEEPVLQAEVLRIIGLAKHRHRQVIRGPKNFQIPAEHFDFTGGNVGVDGFMVPGAHIPVNADNRLRAQPLDNREGRRIRVGYNLRHTVMVAEIHEQQSAMVAYPVHPA